MLWIWTGLSPLVEHWCERFSPRPLQQVRCTVVVWGLTHRHFTQACQLPGYLVATATAWRPHRSPSSHHFGRHGHLFSVGAGVLSGATFSQFQEDEEDGWERPNSDSSWGVLSRPIRRHTADRRPPPPPTGPRLHLHLRYLQSLLVHSNQCFSKFVCHDSVSSGSTRCWWVVCVSAVEGMKVVEIEKCRNDIKKLREEMASRNNRWQRQTLSLPGVTDQIHSGTVDVSMLTAANRLILLTVVEFTWESQEACDWLKEEKKKSEIIKS